jgi:hypothetical protein
VQPLNLTFEEPLKDSFNRERDRYLRRSAREEMMPYDPAYFSTKAICRLVKWKKWISDFGAADVCLLNQEIFSEAEYELNEKINKLTWNLKETVLQWLLWHTAQVSTQNAVYFANHSLGGSYRPSDFMLRQVQAQLHPMSRSKIRKFQQERQKNSQGHYTVLLLRRDVQNTACFCDC